MHLFVDESKAGAYLLVAACVEASTIATARHRLDALLLPGQKRIHMKNERKERRDLIAKSVTSMGQQCCVLDAGRCFPTERQARAACLEMLIGRYPRATTLTLERDESLVDFDRTVLFKATRGLSTRPIYTHASAADEPLLSLPDIVARCWARGGLWRDRIRPVAQRMGVEP